jgi:ankyrin repeat protein
MYCIVACGDHQTMSESELYEECSNFSPSMDRIRQLVNANPDEVQVRSDDFHGGIPLHAACRAFKNGEGSFELVQYLVKQWPESVQVAGRDGDLPLHCACVNMAPLCTVQYLVEQWPDSVKDADEFGRLPLHYTYYEHSFPEEEVIQFLIQQWPESVKTADNHGGVPLHYACAHEAPLHIVQYLVEQWPESVKAADDRGQLPLHSACAHKAPLEVVQYLVEQWPESVKYRNSDGETPLDIVTRQQREDGSLANKLVMGWLKLPWRDEFNETGDIATSDHGRF